MPEPQVPLGAQEMPRPEIASDRLAKGPDEKFCFECGAVIRLKAEICPKCGVRQVAAPTSGPLGRTTTSGRNKFVAALFALFLGGFGIHKFYLGQSGYGVLYLVFCWTFIPFLIGLIEGIGFLLMSEEAFARRYGGA